MKQHRKNPEYNTEDSILKLAKNPLLFKGLFHKNSNSGKLMGAFQNAFGPLV